MSCELFLVNAEDGGQESTNAHSFERLAGFFKKNNDPLPANTAPFCCVLKLWFVENTRGIAEKVKYKTAQLNATHKEKKNTTGSVKSKSVGSQPSI